MINWKASTISPDGSHHQIQDKPMYPQRFDDVQKFHDPGLAPIRLKGKACHIKPDGSRAYESEFLSVFGFYDLKAAVQNYDGWYHITPEGKPLYAERYRWCGNFQEGFCPVRNYDHEYFHINLLGKSLYPARWKYAGDFRDGIAVVQSENGLSTHIDRHGNLIHDKWFLDLDVFHKGHARACDFEGWTHINKNGMPIYERRFISVEPFYNGQARVEKHGHALVIINELGETLVELREGQ